MPRISSPVVDVKLLSQRPRALKLRLALKAGLTAEGGAQKPAEAERGEAGEEEGHSITPIDSATRVAITPPTNDP